jgi:hypothetical protein
MLTLLYRLVSSLLFVMCAVVQYNDPDPELWISLYLLGGPVLTLILAVRPSFVSLASVWLALMVAFAAYLTRQLLQRFDWQPSGDDESFLWRLLEHELGREIGGTLMLIVHAGLLVFTSGSAGRSSVLPVIGVTLVVAVALVWHFFQNEMTARYRAATPHCDNALKF